MYVGHFVVTSPGIGAYRASFRSFPNRQVVDRDDALTIGPTPDAPETDSPYIAYSCAREGDDYVTVGDGSQAGPVAKRLDPDYPPRDMLAGILLALDCEGDDYNTPRIVGIVSNDKTYVGIVRRGVLVVEAVTEPILVATYEEDSLCAFDLNVETVADAARELYDHEFEHVVCAAAVTVGDAVEASFYNGE